LVFGSETMPYDIVNNWRLVESDQRIIGDFMWTSWDYLGECSLAAWSDDPTPVSKPYPWLCADTGALDLLGDPTGEAALAKTMWGDPTSPLLFVRPADLPRPYTAPWRGTNSVPCWSWRGSEGNLTTVEVYTRAPIAKLYLNGRHQGTRRVRDLHADFRVRYEPGELIAVACTAEGLELGRSVLKSAEGLLDLRLTVESCDAGVAFVRVDVTDSTGTVEGSAYDEVSVRVTNGELIAFGSAAQKSTCSYVRGTFPLRYGRGLAVVRMSQGECTVSASAAGMHAELRLA
jgi:beta-galactosidase